MAKGGSRAGGRARDAAGKRRGAAPGSAAKPKPRRPQPSPGPPPTPPDHPPMPTTFLLGAIPGATPGKWIDTWKERMPRTSLELVPLAFSHQRRPLIDGEVDAALVRLPIDKDGLHVIPLYDEVPVVVCAKESHLTAAAELDTADLVGEVLIVPDDDVLGIVPAPPPGAAGASPGASGRVGPVPGTETPRFAPPADTAEAIATVAAGVGIVIVPMSLARLHQRKDVEYRPLLDGPTSTVALAWAADRTTPAVDAFVGIVRGRTANSSRG